MIVVLFFLLIVVWPLFQLPRHERNPILLMYAITITIGAAVLASTPAQPTELPSGVRVVDGDTVDIRGVRIRIKGIDTPETWRPRCRREEELGLRAKARLEELLRGDGMVWWRVEPGRDRYGRVLASVFVGSVSVGDVLMQEGHALKWTPGAVSKAWRLRQWCP